MQIHNIDKKKRIKKIKEKNKELTWIQKKEGKNEASLIGLFVQGFWESSRDGKDQKGDPHRKKNLEKWKKRVKGREREWGQRRKMATKKTRGEKTKKCHRISCGLPASYPCWPMQTINNAEAFESILSQLNQGFALIAYPVLPRRKTEAPTTSIFG